MKNNFFIILSLSPRPVKPGGFLYCGSVGGEVMLGERFETKFDGL
jgi:hypothetical protein